MGAVTAKQGGAIAPAGELGLKVIRGGVTPVDPTFGLGPVDPTIKPIVSSWPELVDDRLRLDTKAIRAYGLPSRHVPAGVNEWRIANQRHLFRGLRRAVPAKLLGIPTMFGALWGSIIRADGEVIDLGLMSCRVVTTAGVGFIVDAFQNIVEVEIMKYHGVGTGTNAEASGDTALQTESTTALNPDSTRATGSTTEGASANIYRTVGTNTFDASAAITEHGILSQAATGGGTLLDRSVFSALNMISGDSLQTTYDLTFTAGG